MTDSPPIPCSVEGCANGGARIRGMCKTHYNQTLPNRHRKHERVCVWCGSTWMAARADAKFCDDACKSLAYKANGHGQRYGKVPSVCDLPSDHPVRRLIREQAMERFQKASSLTAAIESQDLARLAEELRERAWLAPDGCWVWPRLTRDGYPRARSRGRDLQLHRIVVEIMHGRPLGEQAAHHKCGNSACVNPRHLEPVTAAANAAEMLARTYMEKRIDQLEHALRGVCPTHPALNEISIARDAS